YLYLSHPFLCRLYLPHKDSSSLIGSISSSQKTPLDSRFSVRMYVVSGLFTSPYDHEQIMSGEARPMRITSKSSTALCCLKSFSRSFICHHLPQKCSLTARSSVSASDRARC